MKFRIGNKPALETEPTVRLIMEVYNNGDYRPGAVTVFVVETNGIRIPLVTINKDGSIERWILPLDAIKRLNLCVDKDNRPYTE